VQNVFVLYSNKKKSLNHELVELVTVFAAICGFNCEVMVKGGFKGIPEVRKSNICIRFR
jgi:hypothetical protein